MSNCNSLENFYYNIDGPNTCSNAFNGYPKTPNVTYEYLDEVPKPNKFDKCSHSTIYGGSWDQVLNFKWDTCKGIIYSNKSGNFKIKGTSTAGVLKYWAAAPNTCTYSVCGSGLPFPNEEIAYENTPNKGEIKVGSNGKFEIILKYPAGYYINGGEIYVPPHVNIKLCGSNDNILTRIQLPVEPAFRSLGFNLSNQSKEWQPVPYKK
jgi:hypothetical protein